jgi:hypothetical protein
MLEEGVERITAEVEDSGVYIRAVLESVPGNSSTPPPGARLVPFENGLRVHRAILGSKMLRLDGVGHDVPPSQAERVVDAIIA